MYTGCPLIAIGCMKNFYSLVLYGRGDISALSTRSKDIVLDLPFGLVFEFSGMKINARMVIKN